MTTSATTRPALNPLQPAASLAYAPLTEALAAGRPLLRHRVLALGPLQRALLAIIVLDIPFHCDIHYRYDQHFADLNALGGLQLSLTTFCVVGLYALWFAESAIRRFTVSSSGTRINRWLILYLFAAMLSARVAPRGDLAFFELVILVQTFLIYLYVIKRVRTRDDGVYLATMLVISLLCHSLVVFGVFAIGHEFQFGPWHFEIDGYRVGGTMPHNTSASFMELLLAPSLGIAIGALQPWRSRLATIAFLAGGVALVLTFSRGGWLAGIASVGLFSAFAWRRGWLSLRLPMILGIGLCLAAAPFFGAIYETVSGKDRSPADDRFALMRLAQHVISDHPISGVGSNNFAVVMMDYVRHPEFTDAWVHVVHNKYLLVWAENGTIGLIAFLGFLASTILCGYRCWRSNDRLLASIGLGLTMGVFGHLLHMNLDLFNTRPQIQILWLMCGLVASIEAIASRVTGLSGNTARWSSDHT